MQRLYSNAVACTPTSVEVVRCSSCRLHPVVGKSEAVILAALTKAGGTSTALFERRVWDDAVLQTANGAGVASCSTGTGRGPRVGDHYLKAALHTMSVLPTSKRLTPLGGKQTTSTASELSLASTLKVTFSANVNVGEDAATAVMVQVSVGTSTSSAVVLAAAVVVTFVVTVVVDVVVHWFRP